MQICVCKPRNNIGDVARRVFVMAVEWQRSNSYESALTEECAFATEKLCPAVTRVCRGSGSNAVRISPEQDVWKACTRELFLDFVDLTYKVKLSRSGRLVHIFLHLMSTWILRIDFVLINFIHESWSST